MDYWIVHASIRLAGAVLSSLPLLSVARLCSLVVATLSSLPFVQFIVQPLLLLVSSFCSATVAGLPQLELVAYLWFYSMPYLFSHNDNLKMEGRPLQVLAPMLRTLHKTVYDNVSSIVSEPTWQTYVCNPTLPFLKLAVTVRLLRPTTSEWLTLAIMEGRALIVPFTILWTPLPFVSTFAVMYVQYVLPIGKKQRTDDTARLQYWVLHVFLQLCLRLIQDFLWYIPFSNVAVFAVWWYLSWNMTPWYDMLQRDLQVFGLLPGDEGMDISASTTAQVIQWIVSKLPSAAKDDGGAREPQGTNAQELVADADSTDAPNNETPRVRTHERLANANETVPADDDNEVEQPLLAGDDSADDESASRSADDEPVDRSTSRTRQHRRVTRSQALRAQCF
jgi:hypothetical protein